MMSLERLKDVSRANTRDLIDILFPDFLELCGDRLYGDDRSIIGGIATIQNIKVTVIGQIRGHTLRENINCNFSMTYPEGYRKSIRLMKQAEKFQRPIICFIDTIGAHPGLESEVRGQIYAISQHIKTMFKLNVPILSILIGQGGSGGALALCIADRIAALEFAVLNVISPRAYAEIVWKDMSREILAANEAGMTAEKLLQHGIVDKIISEPTRTTSNSVQEQLCIELHDYIINELIILKEYSSERLISERYLKFRNM